MYLIYFIKCEQDFHRMIALHPDVIFGAHRTVNFDQFTQGFSLPMAGFVNTTSNRLTRSSTAYARRRLCDQPNLHTRVNLPELLSHVQVLRKFLKANRAYSKFKRNALKATNFRDNATSESTLLIDALVQCSFSWHDSPEGRNYWSELCLKWQALVRHFNLDKEVIGNYHGNL